MTGPDALERPPSVSVSEAARLLSIDAKTVLRWIDAGRIPDAWRERSAGRYGFAYRIPTRWIRSEIRRQDRRERRRA